MHEILEDKILYIRDAIPNHKDVIDYIEANEDDIISPWQEWTNFYKTVDDDRKDYGHVKSIYADKINSGSDPKIKNITESVSKAIIEASNKYAELFNIEFKPKQTGKDSYGKIMHLPNLAVQRYDKPENNYGGAVLWPHTDHPDPDNMEEHTVLIYWNDDYVGGEVIFPKIDITLKPTAGSILVFRSADLDLIHHTNLVSSGYKYISLYLWVQGFIKGFPDDSYNFG